MGCRAHHRADKCREQFSPEGPCRDGDYCPDGQRPGPGVKRAVYRSNVRENPVRGLQVKRDLHGRERPQVEVPWGHSLRQDAGRDVEWR